MRLRRICRARFAGAAASGEGARLFGGRWNSRGVSVVYTSTSLALAAVEIFVNLEPNLAPDDYVSIALDVPDSLATERIGTKTLLGDWYRSRNESLRRLGDEWIRLARTVGMFVPSAVIRGDWNMLLNPAHADFAKIKFQDPEPFGFDARMFR
jgi:RES domain-containing protein